MKLQGEFEPRKPFRITVLNPVKRRTNASILDSLSTNSYSQKLAFTAQGLLTDVGRVWRLIMPLTLKHQFDASVKERKDGVLVHLKRKEPVSPAKAREKAVTGGTDPLVISFCANTIDVFLDKDGCPKRFEMSGPVRKFVMRLQCREKSGWILVEKIDYALYDNKGDLIVRHATEIKYTKKKGVFLPAKLSKVPLNKKGKALRDKLSMLEYYASIEFKDYRVVTAE